MAFRTTADIMDYCLRKGGEPTSGTSAYETILLDDLNRAYHAVIAGGTIFDATIDEDWIWAKAKRPIVIELQPKYTTGSISLTNGSEVGAFSSAPTDSLQGYYLRNDADETWYQIAQHTAGATAFELDGLYAGTTASAATYRAVKLDYELSPSHIVIDSRNNKIDFEETASSELTATLTAGSYTPSALATEVKTQLDSAGASTYTISYDSDTRKFTLASNRLGGGGTFKLLGATGSNVGVSALPVLGIDYEDHADAASHVATNIHGAIARLVQPFRIYLSNYARTGKIEGIDAAELDTSYPRTLLEERVPNHFAIVEESDDGAITVRFNSYPTNAMRVEIDYIPLPLDLKDNAGSVPLWPRKNINVLEDMGIALLLTEKNDDKAAAYAGFASAGLKAMRRNTDNQKLRTSGTFGQTVARIENTDRAGKLIYGYTSEDC